MSFPVKAKLLRGCEGVALRTSFREISYRKVHFSYAANAWQHCFASMLSPHVDIITLVGRFGTGKSFPFAARKTAPLLLSDLKGPNSFILQISLASTRASLMHLQDQVATELLVCSRSLSCQGLQEEMEEEVQGPAVGGDSARRTPLYRVFLDPYVPPFSQPEPQGPGGISVSPKHYHKLCRHIVTTCVCIGSPKDFCSHPAARHLLRHGGRRGRKYCFLVNKKALVYVLRINFL